MADYTPTTEEVCARYIEAELHDCLLGASREQVLAFPDAEPTGEEFRRWLAAHDREVAANAWDEGFEEPRECCGLCPLRSCPWDNGGDGPTNPYREGGAS